MGKKLMKSRFNIEEAVEDGVLVYNTNSGGILHLDKENTEKYYAILNGMTLSEDDMLMRMLIQGNMLIDQSERDELGEILLENKVARFGGSVMGLTIAPTMACNFRCPYCYEKGKEYVTMNQKTVEEIKKYFRQLKEEYKYVEVTWYGGEPLLAFDIITELMEELWSDFGSENVFAGAVTNGYLLTKDIVADMKKLNINNIQVTIDGPPEIHNERRRLPSGKDTFFVILNNLKDALEIYPELIITIRINVDKTNINRVDEIEMHLEQFGLLDKVGVYVAPVTNINETCVDNVCFNVKEFALEEIKLMQRRGMDYYRMPFRSVYMCGAVASNSLLIDAKGDLYKCWDDVGDEREKVGSLFQKNEGINRNMLKWLSHSIEEDEECMRCAYLPVCMGGCANYHIKYKNKRCHPIKENANQMVRLVYELLRQRMKEQ